MPILVVLRLICSGMILCCVLKSAAACSNVFVLCRLGCISKCHVRLFRVGNFFRFRRMRVELVALARDPKASQVSLDCCKILSWSVFCSLGADSVGPGLSNVLTIERRS
ncbi:hypothetical protein L195_g006175 [Trifolium pratense]|uniref:Secreted protein n=1 Tax=Trifolium pratense TaxID=57577 RepID=A0A2K3P2V7_TRIPR|nr:hypothetical protein L195_g006175 [Trifolium pratense]